MKKVAISIGADPPQPFLLHCTAQLGSEGIWIGGGEVIRRVKEKEMVVERVAELAVIRICRPEMERVKG